MASLASAKADVGDFASGGRPAALQGGGSMKRFEDRITINAPAGRVFDYVADFTRHGEWAKDGLQVTPSSEGPVAVGSTFSTTAHQFGTQREQSTITELTRASAFAWESTGALGRARHGFALTEDGESTNLSKSAELIEPSFLAKVTSWKLSRDIPKSLHSDLANIKAHLEGSSA
jgi:uncharacterized membrane protein